MPNREKVAGHGLDVRVEGRHVRSDMRQAKQCAIVFQRVVGRSHHAVAIAAAVAHQDDRKLVQADVVADLLERPGVNERSNAVDPGTQARPRQPGGDRDHVLLGNARVDEP